MNDINESLNSLLAKKKSSVLWVQTLGKFEVYREGLAITSKEWGRDRTIQLFQFLVTKRSQNGLHKEQILDRLWSTSSDQNFKVALHGVNKVLEPDRPSRTEPKFIQRQGLTYQLNLDNIWIDVDYLDKLIELGNYALLENHETAIKVYKEAIGVYHGIYLPNRLYEDWSSEERERIQILALGGIVTLGELMLEFNSLESIRLAEMALQIDNTWEEAYRIKMEAYLKKGNRPMVIKSYQNCVKILDEEFGIEPLPETKRWYKEAMR